MKNSSQKNAGIYALGFLIPVLAFLTFSLINKIYPFGNISIMNDDMEIQYVDYFMYLKNVLCGQAGVSYSFTKSLGGSAIALFGYYLSSPLNLLVLFFKKSQMQLFFFTLIAIKIGLCGLTFSIFARRRFSVRPYAAVLLSVAYAFTQYNVGQMRNINWLDGVYLLPLMMLGVYEYVKSKKPGLLIAAVCASIVFNWYTAYMNCIFIVIYFIYEKLIADEKFNIKEFVVSGLKFLFAELTGVLASCAFFLPVLLNQSEGRSVLDDGVLNWNTNGSFLNIFRGFLIGSSNPSKDITVFCSVFMLICIAGYFVSKRFSGREKLFSGAFLLVLLFSLFFVPIENIWCGFKWENSYYYRFLYVVIAGFLVIAAQFLADIRGESKTFAAVSGGLIAAFLVFDMIRQFDSKRLWIEIVLLVLYAAFLTVIISKQKKHLKRASCTAVAILFVAEILFNANCVGGSRLVIDKNIFEEYSENQIAMIEQIKQADTDLFYRIDQTQNRDKSADHTSFYANESMAYGYSSIQHYSSSYENSTAEFLAKLGYCRGSFPTFYHDPILPADSLLGVKYLLSEEAIDGYTKAENMEEYNGKAVYVNNSALPLGFGASSSALNIENSDNPFEFMNNIYSGIVGEKVELFTKTRPKTETDESKNVIYTFEKGSGDLYLSILGKNTEILVNGVHKTFSDYEWVSVNVLNIGSLEEEITVTLKPDEAVEEDPTAEFYVLDTELFASTAEKIAADKISLESFKDGAVSASYTAKQDGYVMLTVPYDAKWQVTVNGKKTEISVAAGALTLIPVTQGENNIKMNYKTKGLLPGVAVSIVTVAGIIGIAIYKRRKKKI